MLWRKINRLRSWRITEAYFKWSPLRGDDTRDSLEWNEEGNSWHSLPLHLWIDAGEENFMKRKEEVYSPGQAGRSVTGEVIKYIDRKDYGASVIYPKCDASSLESFEQGETRFERYWSVFWLRNAFLER